MESTMYFATHTQQCIMIIIGQSHFLAIHYLSFKANRDTQISINIFLLHISTRLCLIGIILSDTKSRIYLNHTNDLPGSNRIITIHDTNGKILHLSVTKNCSHKKKRKQRKYNTRHKVNAT